MFYILTVANDSQLVEIARTSGNEFLYNYFMEAESTSLFLIPSVLAENYSHR